MEGDLSFMDRECQEEAIFKLQKESSPLKDTLCISVAMFLFILIPGLKNGSGWKSFKRDTKLNSNIGCNRKDWEELFHLLNPQLKQRQKEPKASRSKKRAKRKPEEFDH